MIRKQLDDTALLIVYPDPTEEYPFLWRIVWSGADDRSESAERPAVSVDDAVEKAYELLLFWDTLVETASIHRPVEDKKIAYRIDR